MSWTHQLNSIIHEDEEINKLPYLVKKKRKKEIQNVFYKLCKTMRKNIFIYRETEIYRYERMSVTGISDYEWQNLLLHVIVIK